MQQQERHIPGVQIINRCESTAARKKASLTKEADSGSRLLFLGYNLYLPSAGMRKAKPHPLPSLISYCSAKFSSKGIYSYAFLPFLNEVIEIWFYLVFLLTSLLSLWYKYWRLPRELSVSKGISRNVKLICSGRESACQAANVISIGTRRCG